VSISFPYHLSYFSLIHTNIPDALSVVFIQSWKFFVNVPSILAWIFWAFKSLVSAQTFAKMSVVGSRHHAIAKALGQVLDMKELPKRYGGQAKGF
jgi:hypothetical protein